MPPYHAPTSFVHIRPVPSPPHRTRGQTLNDRAARQKEEHALAERARKQQKAGVSLLKEAWPDLLILLTPAVRDAVEDLVRGGRMREGEWDNHEIKTLATFPEAHGLAVVGLFRDGEDAKKIGNKSGF